MPYVLQSMDWVLKTIQKQFLELFNSIQTLFYGSHKYQFMSQLSLKR